MASDETSQFKRVTGIHILYLFKNFWSILCRKDRLFLCVIILLLVIVGCSEMLSMAIIYTYISIVSDNFNIFSFSHVPEFLSIYKEESRDFFIAGLAGFFLIFSFLIKNVFTVIVDYGLQKFLMRQYYKVIADVTQSLQTPESIKRNREHLEKVWYLFNNGFKPILQIISSFIVVCTITFFLIMLKVNLAFVIVTCLSFSCILIHYFSRQKQTSLALEQKEIRFLSWKTLKVFHDAEIDIQLSNTQNYFINRYLNSERQATSVNRSLSFLRQLPGSINEVILSVIIAFSMGYFMISDIEISGNIVSIIAVFAYAGLRLSKLFSKITVDFQHLDQSKDRFHSVTEYIRDLKYSLNNCELTDQREVLNPFVFRHNICVRNLSFTYKSQSSSFILNDINLDIPKGAVIGIFGPSGAGKTTLLHVLSGLITPSHGSILCDDIDIFSDVQSWHSQIGLVVQNPYILDGTIQENIAFGVAEGDVDLQKIYNILKDVKLDNFVKNLAEQTHFKLNQNRPNLSQGQMQRLSLARALYRDPDILMIDEGLSGLETSLQHKILETLRLQSKTIIHVTHRTEVMAHADVIYTLDKGRLRKEKSYKEFMSRL